MNAKSSKPYPFSEWTLQHLLKAGWSEDYRGDVKLFEEDYRSRGYPIVPAVMDFLERFGGLDVYSVESFILPLLETSPSWLSRLFRRQPKPPEPRYLRQFYLRPVHAMSFIRTGTVGYYEDVLQVTL